MIRGRQYIRTRALCHGCEARRMIGEPKGNDVWAQRLTLSEQQMADLMAGAAEYRDLCEQENIVETAVEFLDWAFVDVRRRSAA